MSARAQQSGGTIARVGFLVSGSVTDREQRTRSAAFFNELAKLGWADGRNLKIDHRWGANTPELRQTYAKELVSLAPNVIFTHSSPNTEVLQRETQAVPIVFVGASDPLSSGLISSMAHPGGNVTGFANFEFPMGAKWLELLKEVAPGVTRLLVLLTEGNTGNEGLLRAIKAAAPRLGVVEVITLDPRLAELNTAFAAVSREGNGGLIELPAAGLDQPEMIVRLAAQHRLPAIYALRPFIASGGLMSYDTDIADLYRRAALAAQYESVLLPLGVILIVPMCLLAAISGVLLRGMDNNILTQIRFVVLIGLAAKNAILIVEFSKQAEEHGANRWDAAVEAARTRLRPILMTSLAFVLGVVPLVLATGAGAEMRQALGTAVFFGMLGVTLFGLFFTPVFYVLVRWLGSTRPIREHVEAQTQTEPVVLRDPPQALGRY
jgi:ABC-type uncharacterized transport system substrate-binding protein